MKLIFYTFLIVGLSLKSQTNIVPNPGFENIESGLCDHPGAAGSYNQRKEFWDKVDNWSLPLKSRWLFCVPASPDIFCNSRPYNFENNLIRRGDYSARMLFQQEGEKKAYKEYITVMLNTTLSVSTIYYFEFYYKLWSASDKFPSSGIGGVFLSEEPTQCSTNSISSGHLNNDETLKPVFYSTTEHFDKQWIRASGYFSVNDNNLKWLVLGAWYDNDNSFNSTSIVMDDIKIIDVGNNYCPLIWLFDDISFNHGPESYQASNKIIIGKGADPEVIDGDVVVKSGSYLKLKAPEIIEMIPGFTVEEGAKYIAEIAPCESSPCALPVTKNTYVICKPREQLDVVDQNSVKNNWIVEWSPAQYVDDPTNISPIFLSPPGAGKVNLTLKVTNLCGTISKTFKVYYSDNFPNEAELDISNFQKDVSFLSFDVAIQNSPADIKITIPEVNYEENQELFPVDGQNKYHWDSPNEKLLSCETYTVIVESTNRCSGETKSQSFTWDRSSPLSTTGTTNILVTASETNNKLFVYGQGIRSYSTVILNRQGRILEKENGVVRTYPAPFFTAKGNYSTGSYEFVVTFTGCNGEKQVNNGYFEWINNRAPESMELIDSSELSNTNEEVYDLKFAAYEPDEVIEKDDETNFYDGVEEIKLFPNPVKSQLNLSSKGIMEGDIIIYNNIGKIVIQQKVNDYQKVIQTNELKNGLYLLKVVEKDGTEHHFKFIKQ
jgi:hypothetical protein